MNHETPSYNQITEQQTHKASATVLTRRTNGEVQTAEYIGQEYEVNGDDRYYVKLNGTGENGEPLYRSISPRELSDDGQALLANELAESVDRGLGSWERVGSARESLGDTAIRQVVEMVPLADHREESVASLERESIIKLKAENIERSIAELDRVFTGELARLFEGVVGDSASRRKAIDPNSGDPILRDKLGSMLRETIDELGNKQMLPERIQENSPGNLKNIPSSKFGYEAEKYLSRDYAAKLALAMLDGSFDGDPNKRDYVDLPADDPRNGQHRQAARMALDELAERKAQQGEVQEQDHEDDESFNEIRRAIEQLSDDGVFQDVDALTRGLSDQYSRGLPDFFDPHEVMYQLQQHIQQLRAFGDDIELIVRRIHSVVDLVDAKSQDALEDLRAEMNAVHTQIENSIYVEYALTSKLDELLYDRNAEMEVRSLFAQQLPLALGDLSRAFVRIRSLAD